MEPGPHYHQLAFYKTKCTQALLDRMCKRMCNPQKKNIKTHIMLEFPANPRGHKCKIPTVRSPKPAVFAVEPAPQDHQLTFSNTRIPRNPKGQKCKIPIVRSPKPALFAVEPAPQYHQLTFYKTKMHKGIARQHVQKNVQSTKKEHQNTYNTRIPRESQVPKM